MMSQPRSLNIASMGVPGTNFNVLKLEQSRVRQKPKSFVPTPLQSQRLLRRLGRAEVDALEFEHLDLRGRSAGRRESADLAAGGEHAVAWDDESDRVFRHHMTDIACVFPSAAKFFREHAVGGCVAPADAPRGCINLLEEVVLPVEIELDIRELDLLAREIALYAGDCISDLWRRRSRFRAGQASQQTPFGRFGALSRQLEPRDADAAPGDAASAARGFEDEIVVRCLAHGMTPAFNI